MKYKLLVLSLNLIFLIFFLSFVFGYTAPDFSNIDSTLRSGYTADNFSNINLILGEGEIPLDTEYPQFSNYWDNNGTLINSGIGLFNVTVTSTNGTVWLEINNTNITATNTSRFCYQETANISTACGGLNTGIYWSSGGWTNIENTYDGNWTTFGRTSETESYLFINYTKPSTSINSSLWQVKDASATVNLSIPSHCWNQIILQFMVKSDGSPPPESVYWYCKNDTGWFQLRGGISGNENVYEEAMIWNINIYNASYNFTTNGTYTYRWHSWGNGTSRLYNKSIDRIYTVNTTVDTCTYVSGNWNVNCADNCSIVSNINLGFNNIIFTNSGTFRVGSNITNINKWEISSGCKIIINPGQKFG